MGPWKYKVDISSAVRTLEDLEPGQIDVKLARRNLAAAFRRAKANLPPNLAESFEGLAQAVERKKTVKGIDEVLSYLYDLADEERIWLMEPPGPRDWLPKAPPPPPSMGGMEDVPLPPNTPRPEMWTAESIVQAVKDGFTFLVTFVHWKGYWIGGSQYDASAFTLGPAHTPEIRLLDDGWIQAKTYFMPEMVPERTWLTPPNKNGVVPVYVEIDPETIDWDILNRGYQGRSGRMP